MVLVVATALLLISSMYVGAAAAERVVGYVVGEVNATAVHSHVVAYDVYGRPIAECDGVYVVVMDEHGGIAVVAAYSVAAADLAEVAERVGRCFGWVSGWRIVESLPERLQGGVASEKLGAKSTKGAVPASPSTPVLETVVAAATPTEQESETRARVAPSTPMAEAGGQTTVSSTTALPLQSPSTQALSPKASLRSSPASPSPFAGEGRGAAYHTRILGEEASSSPQLGLGVFERGALVLGAGVAAALAVAAAWRLAPWAKKTPS